MKFNMCGFSLIILSKLCFFINEKYYIIILIGISEKYKSIFNLVIQLAEILKKVYFF